MTIPPTEPSADIRQAASALWQVYVALVAEGFSERQALTVIGQMLIAQQRGGDDGQSGTAGV